MLRSPRVLALTAAVLALLGGTAAAAWTLPAGGSSSSKSPSLSAPTGLTVASQSCTATTSAGSVAWRAQAGATGTTTVTASRPVGTVAGDVIVAAYSTPATSPAVTAPAGWTQVRYDSYAGITSAVYVHVAAADDPAGWTWTTTASVETSALQLLSYSGVDTSSPVSASAAAHLTTTSATAPSVAPLVPDGQLLALYAIATNAGWTGGAAGLTTRVYGTATGTSAATSVTYGSGDQGVPDLAATPARTATAGAAGPSVGQALVLRPSGAGAVSVLHVGSTQATGAATVALSRPADVQVNDVLVAVIGKRQTAGTLSTPAGWNLVLNTPSGTAYQQSAFWRRATAADTAGTTYSFSTGDTSNAVGVLTAYRNVGLVTAVDTSGGQASTTTSVTAPSITTTPPNTRLLGLFGVHGAVTVAAPASMTGRRSAQIASGSPNNQLYVTVADQAAPTAGATGSRVATASGATNGVGQLVALRAVSSPLANLSWAASPSTFLDGYRLGRSVDGTEVTSTTLAPELTSYTTGASVGLTPGTTYSLTLRAKVAGWLSAGAATTSFTATSSC